MSPRLKPTVLAAGGGASGGPLGHEGGALLNGISALNKRDQRTLSPSFRHAKTQRAASSLHLGRGPSPEPTRLVPLSQIPPELQEGDARCSYTSQSMVLVTAAGTKTTTNIHARLLRSHLCPRASLSALKTGTMEAGLQGTSPPRAGGELGPSLGCRFSASSGLRSASSSPL